jgi:thiol:disulfide interchange protein
MSKIIISLSLVGLAILFTFGLLAPNNPIMWMASTSENFALLRFGLMVMLATLLVTNPPRNLYLRALIGSVALFMTAWSLGSTYNNQMKLLDTMSVLQVNISAALIILERRVLPKPADSSPTETKSAASKRRTRTAHA